MKFHFLQLIIFPLISFIVNLAIKEKKTRLISTSAFVSIGICLVLNIGILIDWIIVYKGNAVKIFEDVIFSESHFDFKLEFILDKISFFYLIIGSFLTFIITIYSRYYMFRESGFKRFFNNILFFYLGYNITVMAGNLETLFIGWEILGLSSFLLISFYWMRYIPVRNSIKVYSIYRIGDVGILMAIWMSHHIWHGKFDFYQLNQIDFLKIPSEQNALAISFLCIMLLIAALAKSAQFPFTAWLPRAMEGPTPSSAIFYGSLSVHIGAFLLLRSYPLYQDQLFIRIIIFITGLLTAVISSFSAQVQTNIKGKIAYSSAAQIGLIFIEIALGWHILALIHIAGNAFLRTYQLLISPSVVAYLIREQFYENETPQRQIPFKSVFLKRLYMTVYVLSMKEWNLENMLFKFIFEPIKKMRKIFHFVDIKQFLMITIPLYILGIIHVYSFHNLLHDLSYYFSLVSAFIALVMASKSYNERKSTRLAWLMAVFSHFFVDLSVIYNYKFNAVEASLYLSGIIISGLLGFSILQWLRSKEYSSIGLQYYHGYKAKYRRVSFLFLLACLGVSGFPITTSFFGEDIVLSHVKKDQWLLALLISITFIINGIALIRIYARIFLGSYQLNYQNTKEITF